MKIDRKNNDLIFLWLYQIESSDVCNKIESSHLHKKLFFLKLNFWTNNKISTNNLEER